MSNINEKHVSELTEEELDQLLKERRKKAQAEKERKERDYRKKKNQLVNELHHKAFGINDLMKEFKNQAFEQLLDFYELMKEHGEVKKDGKGNFTLKSEDGNLKVEFSNQVVKEFDERAEMAAEHLRTFLSDFVKKRDQGIYEWISQVLQKRNDKFDVNLIGRLFQMEERFDHPSWKKAIELFKASYTEVNTAQYVRFQTRNEKTGQYDSINLNFASL